MKIKRTALIVIIITVIAVLFSSSVFADTSPSPRETQTNSSVVNNVTFNIKVSRFYTDATTALQGGGTLPYFVSIAVINNNDEPALVNGLRYKIVFSGSDTYYFQGYENYSTDLFTTMLPTDANSYVSVSPSNEYSYGNGIVVPPHKAMYLCCMLELATTLDQTTMTWPTPTMSHAYFPNDITVTTGDYPYNGEPVDLSPIELYLSQIETSNAYILDEIRNMIDVLTYTGSTYNPQLAGGSTSTASNTEYQSAYGLTINVTRKVAQPYYIVNDFEYDSSTDTYTSYGTVRYPVFLFVSFENMNTDKLNIRYRRYFYIQNLIPQAYSLQVSYLSSDFVGELSLLSDGRVGFISNHVFGNNAYVPYGYHYLTMICYVDVPSNTSITFGNMSVGLYGTVTTSSGYYPVDEYTVLRDLYIAYSQVNGLDDLEDDSDALDTTGSQVHAQEQAYYSANRSAIEATGLQNYQFSQDQTNGIGAVSNDFTALWNAMGSWTGVYIFSLTIGLAMMILRHVPGMVRSHRGKSTDD